MKPASPFLLKVFTEAIHQGTHDLQQGMSPGEMMMAGLELGIEIAQHNPEIAKRLVDEVDALRVEEVVGAPSINARSILADRIIGYAEPVSADA